MLSSEVRCRLRSVGVKPIRRVFTGLLVLALLGLPNIPVQAGSGGRC
jgi:hypothetical protein